jgi:hypothetical protein
MGDNNQREGRPRGAGMKRARLALQKLYQNDKLMLNIQSSMRSILMKAGKETS